MADYAAALDQGTTSSRCMIFDHGGNVVAVEQLEHEQILSLIHISEPTRP